MRQKSGTSKESADKLVKNIRRKTRQTYSAEEKIRIVLAGLRGEESIASLCRREGIAESLYYSWSKELLEAGERSPLKHTVNVPPMSTVTIEFEANETRDWFFHCHMLYHMATGMAAVVSYEQTSQATDKTLVAISKDRHWYSFADIGVQSNKLHTRLWSLNGHGEASIEGEYDWKDDYEVEARYSHFLVLYAELSVGLKAEGHHDEKQEQVGLIGLRYVLPMNIEAEMEVHTDGHVLFELGSELQLTDRASLEWHWNSDNEYELGLSYALSKAISLTASHGNRFGTGAGLMLSF